MKLLVFIMAGGEGLSPLKPHTLPRKSTPPLLYCMTRPHDELVPNVDSKIRKKPVSSLIVPVESYFTRTKCLEANNLTTLDKKTSVHDG